MDRKSDVAQLHLAVAIFTFTLMVVITAIVIGGIVNG